jgi:phosphonate transport system substrate-binding protein
MFKILYFLLIVFALSCMVSCYSEHKNADYPSELRFAVSTRDEDPGEARSRMVGMKLYLEKELGIPVKIYETTGYAESIEALKTNKIDLSSMGSFSYILAAENANVEAISCRGTLNGEIEPYHSIIITWPGSRVKSMEDVKKMSSKLSLAFGDPASTSGHLIPRDYLESIGLTKESFNHVFFANGHSAAILTVRSGKTDIGCVSESVLRKLEHEGKIKPGEFVVLWKSPAIINGAVCIRKAFSTKFKLKVQKALADFRFKDPKNWKLYGSLIAKQTILPYDSLCFINVHDSAFNNLREISARYDLYDKKH